MTRQQRRKQERIEKKLTDKAKAFRTVNPMAEEVHRQAYYEGWHAGCGYCMKVCYAAAALAMRSLYGWYTVRNTRLLRKIDEIVTNTLTSDEVIEEAFVKAGVRINFREAMPEDRVEGLKDE